jgi:glutathione peroxidase
MFRSVIVGLVLTVMVATAAIMFTSQKEPVMAGGTSVLDFKMRDIDGNEVKLDKYKGKVLLIVNTASKCGYTPQYEGLQSVYTKYKDKGFYVLGFPANNFGSQEPGTETEIKEFCTSKYHVTFRCLPRSR